MIKIFAYLVSVVLLVVAFFTPPQAVIDSSVYISVSIMIGGAALLFGKGIKSIHISKTGVEIESFEENQKTD